MARQMCTECGSDNESVVSGGQNIHSLPTTRRPPQTVPEYAAGRMTDFLHAEHLNFGGILAGISWATRPH